MAENADQTRTIALAVETYTDEDAAKVTEVLARAFTGLVLEGYEVQLDGSTSVTLYVDTDQEDSDVQPE